MQISDTPHPISLSPPPRPARASLQDGLRRAASNNDIQEKVGPWESVL